MPDYPDTTRLAPEPEAKSERPKPNPKALSPEYHKARKQLMLWAGILFIWELVGIDLDKARETGGNAGAVITAIKSPQAVPWVLLILVVYFLFKCSVEWAQCNPDRRRVRFARIDFISAWIVSVAAFMLYIGQAISRVQFADLVKNSSGVWSLLFGIIAGSMLTSSVYMAFRGAFRVIAIPVIALLVISIALKSLTGFSVHWTLALVGATAGIIFMTVVFLVRPLMDWLIVKKTFPSGTEV